MSGIFTPISVFSESQTYPIYPPMPTSVRYPKIEDIDTQTQMFYADERFKTFCLSSLSLMNNVLYSPQMLHKLSSHVFIYEGTLAKAFNPSSGIYAFLLKGSSAVPILQKRRKGYTVDELTFTGDFDCTLLVNPAFNASTFKMVREMSIVEIINILRFMITDAQWWTLMIDLYTKCSFGMEYYGPSKIEFKEEALTSDDFDLSTHVYNNPEWLDFIIPKGCPFKMVVHPNLHFKELMLGFTLIKIQTRTVPPHDILDISIPSRQNANLKFDYNITSILKFEAGLYKFYLTDYVTTYIDFRIAAKLDSRPTKRAKRTAMANNIRNTIIPRVLTRKLRTYIGELQGVHHANPDINLETILSNLIDSNSGTSHNKI